MLKVLSLFIIYSFSYLFAQNDYKREIPNHFNYVETEKGKVKIISKTDNNYYIKNIKSYDKESESEANLVIRMDTLKFAKDKYYTWKVIDISGTYKVIALDGNNNGYKEVYGEYVNPITRAVSSKVYEFTPDLNFQMVYETDSLYQYKDFGDIDGDGLIDMAARNVSFQTYTSSMYFFTQLSENQYISDVKTVYNRFVSQFNNIFFYDIDKDGDLEIIYFLLVTNLQDTLWMGNHVAKYNKLTNKVELLYHHRPSTDYYTYGFSHGDFDLDGKGNFATGSSEGDFYIYEHVEDTVYTLEFRDTVLTYNAYLTTFSNDLNGNGKPELWLCGDFFSSIHGAVTRAFVYEYTGSGYEVIFQIDIRGLFSWDVGNMRSIDIDKDGKEEILIYTDQYFFVFNWSADKGYYLNYAMKDPRFGSIVSMSRKGVDVLDFDKDGEFELAFQYQSGGDSSTVFMKRKIIVGVKDDPIKEMNFILHQNYPNPFNSQTNIRFTLPNEEKIKIKIFNVIGEEIIELINSPLKAGEHTIAWDGSDNFGKTVPSGIYFIRFSSNNYNKTIKTVLIK